MGLDARVHSLYLEDIAALSLADRAWRGPDDPFLGTPADARRVLDDMASTLAFMHENGVAHNDIKPGNILFTPAHGAVLIDFGLFATYPTEDWASKSLLRPMSLK